MKSTLTILFLIIINSIIFSQEITIKGVIVDESGKKLKDVNIREKKSSRGTISNGNGTYQLNLPFQKKFIITYSHINHLDKTFEVNLKELQNEMNETDENFIIRNFTLSILPDEYLLNEKKIAIGQLNGGRWSYIKSRRKGNKITCNPKSFGIFTVIQDDKKPTIKAVNLNEKMTNQKSIKFKVKDNFSGINYYSASINGEWILLEYDAKNNLLEHIFEPKTKKNKQNKLILTVKDGLGNTNTQQYFFER